MLLSSVCDFLLVKTSAGPGLEIEKVEWGVWGEAHRRMDATVRENCNNEILGGGGGVAGVETQQEIGHLHTRMGRVRAWRWGPQGTDHTGREGEGPDLCTGYLPKLGAPGLSGFWPPPQQR